MRTKNKKGQLTIIGLITFVILLITFAVLYPLISSVITTLTASSNDTTLNLLVVAIPVFMFLGIIITLFYFIQPRA